MKCHEWRDAFRTYYGHDLFYAALYALFFLVLRASIQQAGYCGFFWQNPVRPRNDGCIRQPVAAIRIIARERRTCSTGDSTF